MRLISTTLLSILLFAANSILCRMALSDNSIDASSFTSIRLLSGMLMLSTIWFFVNHKKRKESPPNKIEKKGSWLGAIVLFIYAAGFSFAYLLMDTGTGALVLFSSVQLTILGFSYWRGTRFNPKEWVGIVLTIMGFIALFYPQLRTPALGSFLLMACAGIAWGVYTLVGSRSTSPLTDTTFNFVRTLPFVILLYLVTASNAHISLQGALLAISSGALASGIGYAIWYSALRGLSALLSSLVQLTVPMIAALGGALFSNEPITLALLLSSALILSGIALVVSSKKQA